jgi:hypothetical protein
MSAELKKMHSRARNQQLRTQMVMNEVLMLSSPLYQYRMAELQKKGARTWTGRPCLPLVPDVR